MPGLSIFLCAFHVMQSLAKSLQQKVACKVELKAMSNELHKMIRINDLGPGEHSDAERNSRIRKEIDAFVDKHPEQVAFVQYFKQHWAPRPGKALIHFKNI